MQRRIEWLFATSTSAAEFDAAAEEQLNRLLTSHGLFYFNVVGDDWMVYVSELAISLQSELFELYGQ